MERSSKCRDMLVRLYELPKEPPALDQLIADGIVIRRAMVPEVHKVVDWVRGKFSKGWADECNAAFAGHPVSCFIATKNNEIIGFSVYDSTALGVAGPIGIDDKFRGNGLGKAMLIHTLQDMRTHGYAYAVIGWVAPKTQPFFEKAVKAEVIARSAPLNGMYAGIILE
jgi:GNAT superfamily N-acetyltransferase